MATLNGRPIDPERLQAHAEAMFDALDRIANGQTGRPESEDMQALRQVARQALAPCHFFDFSVPTGGIACTDPEEMSDTAFRAWLSVIPEEKRHEWEAKRWARARAREYVDRIRNPEKQLYASEYLDFVIGKRGSTKPKGARLSVMAAQAVRMNIHDILQRGKTQPDEPQPKAEQPLLMALDPFTQPALI